ncbi:MAG: bifunctional UDP-N-acetylmuramoyl-tripeptide:D-alanyl-D-alanine ligase/alanine racemase [Bacteroidota bacterium]
MLGLPYTIQQIAQLCGAKDLFQGQFSPEPIRQVAFDSRNISHGHDCLFVALKTANRDGHDYVQAAWEKGVRNFLVEKKLSLPDSNYILAEESLLALQTWAMQHRRRFRYPVIAITGSNGKTIVKEWLATLLEMEQQIVKSPMSYNSQLGVALSLLQMHPAADLAIIEAGISLPGEMELLAEMIQPTLGIMTHFGPAHAEGFVSQATKLAEKMMLFEHADRVLLGGDDQPVVHTFQNKAFPIKRIGRQAEDEIHLRSAQQINGQWQIELGERDVVEKLSFRGTDEADLENALLAILAAREVGLSYAAIRERLPLLYPVQMRREIITDNPLITVINDSYTSDPDSVRNAFQLLRSIDAHPRKFIILTDVPHLGGQQEEVQRTLLQEAEEMVGKAQLLTIGPVFGQLRKEHHFADTDALLDRYQPENFRNSSVLLKGARSLALERLIPFLNQTPNTTWFSINLQHLAHNFRLLKKDLPEDIKTMAMVKAASYGGGTWEIAQVLEQEGVDYLTVAYASEAITLREAGIQLPIMVMNPDVSAIDSLLRYQIEPEVSNLPFLERFLRAARLSDLQEYRIHLKLETGMGRLGFRPEDLNGLISLISQHPDLNVISVMTHLAAADMPEEDAFSLQQLESFQQMYARLQGALGLMSFRHALNTAGLLRFPQYAMDMVRMGIGLYGIDPTDGLAPDLKEIGSLHSRISQIQEHDAGVSVGYGRSQTTTRSSRIATIPVGYADGIPRSLGNGTIAFRIRGQEAPTFGRICMDMLMLDVSDIPEVAVGDEVTLFGEGGPSITELATAADTIAYELMVRISPRVRRVFVRE